MTKELLDPTEALALQCLRYWWSVVKRKKGGEIDDEGRTWTRVSGEEVAEWIEQHYHAELDQRRITRALSRLVEKGWTIRQQRHLKTWNRCFSYAPVEVDREVTSDSSPAPEAQTEIAPDPSNQPEWATREDRTETLEESPVTGLNKEPATSPASSTEKESTTYSGEPDDGGRPEAPEEPQSPPVVQRVGAITNRRADSLKAILERCEGIGKGELPNPWEEGKDRRESCQLEKGARLPEWHTARHVNPSNG